MLNFKRSKLFLMLMSAVAVQTSAKEVQLVETDINDDGYLITEQNLPLFVQDKTNLITQNNRYLFTQDNSNLLAQDNRRFFAQDNSRQNSRVLIKDDDLVIQSSRSFTAQDYNNLLAQNNQNFFVADNSDLVVRSSRPLVKLDNRDIIVRDRRSTITQDDNALVVQGSRPLLAQINHDLIEPEQRDLMTLDNAHLLVQDNRRVIAKDNSHLLVQNSHRLVAQGNSDLVEPEQRDLITSDDDHLIAQDNSQLIAQNNSELTARNSDFTTFNAASLFGGQTNVDLSGFTSRNFISPGHYLVQLSVNSNDLSNDITVQFDHLDGQRSAVLCLDAALLDRLDLKPEIREALPNKPCLTMKELDPDAYYDFDFAELKLALSIPQALRVERPEGYIDPKLFSNGVNSGFIGYAFNYNRDEDRESKYLGLNGGLNVAGWYYRHAGAFESKDSGLGQYYSDQNVIYRDITPMNSRLSLGQFNTTTYRLDNLPIVGAQISSDQDMLPWSYRQYAPVIENFAYTNAVVRVYQNAQKIYERTVPRGAFKINDLNTGNGDLTVEITETGGEKRTFIVPFQSNQDLIRQGRYNYSVAGGRYRTRNETTNDKLFQGSFNYGLTNQMTLGAGLNVSDGYSSALGMLALNTPIGGVTSTIEFTDSDLFGKKYKGEKYGLNYRYAWVPKNFYLYADYAKYNRDYMSISSHLYQRNRTVLTESENDNFLYNYNLKDSIGVSLSKSLADTRFGNVNLSARKNTYWNDSEDYYQYSLSYANSWKKVSYNIGFNRTDYTNRERERGDSAYFSISVPLDWRKQKKMYANASVQLNEQNQFTTNASMSGTAGANNQMNFGLGVSDSQNNTRFNGNFNYLLPMVNMGSTVSVDSSSSQYSLSAQGAVVGHRYGFTPVNSLPETYTIIHAENGAGANVSNAWGVKVDRFGNAIYPFNSAYSKNTISLDPKDLPANVTLESNQTDVIPRKYSSQLAEFKANKTSNLLLRIHATQQQNIPMGSQFKDSDNQVIGIFGAGNQVIVNQELPLMKVSTVTWGGNQNESCQIAPIAKQQLQRKTTGNFNIIDVECK
ncbi:fimbrial biogenesis outer membrane usher protein [Acinetobacter sp. I-MWF]|uniref:fimbria/pilus outer membrane usher protein n=1 Tax=Acinetobacter sp. I-MWF TaxID=2940517 RepID=UPI0021C68EF9|nr:fimbria/pilus outer membrane usher protein [Acinetobacter sp. I-MWF]MCT9977880.1 fimbrial biogenesis outer membrane usher protein [Acinetobacter sp. I-MWF]